MRFVFVLSVLSILGSVTPAGADEISVQLEFGAPTFEPGPYGEVARVERAEPHGLPGEPLLPVRTVRVLLPPGHVALEAWLEDVRLETVPGSHRIAPAPRPFPYSRPDLWRPPVARPDIYQAAGVFPKEWTRLLPVQLWHGFAIQEVQVHPLRVEPTTGRITRLVSARLAVLTAPKAPPALPSHATARDRARVLSRLDESSAIGRYSSGPARTGAKLDPADFPLVIVTPEAFTNIGSSNSLEALRDARIAGGIGATIVTLEWIRQNYAGATPAGGSDDATRVREFIADAYRDWNTRYVILVGDADAADVGGESGDELLPARKLRASIYLESGEVPDDIPADLYYACLDGSFDENRNGVYGEATDGPDGGEVDLYAEVAVGRAPADSATEVEHFVEKTLAYSAAAGQRLKEVWLLGEYLWDGPNGPEFGGTSMDELWHGASVGGYTTVGFDAQPFFTPHTLYDALNSEWSPADLIAVLESAPHIVNHLGHSNEYYNMKLMTSDVDRLTNPAPFLAYSQGCIAGAFDNQDPPDIGGEVYPLDCMAEHFLLAPHAAFAVIMNARYGLGSYGTTDSPSQRFNRQFWDAFFGEGMRTFGEAFNDSKHDNASWISWDDSFRWVGYELNYFGDPTLVLKKNLGTDRPLIAVYPAEASFFASEGADPAPRTILIQNDGVGSLTFSASSDQPWLEAVPATGTAPQNVDVQVHVAGLSPGEYQGQLTFQSPEAENGAVVFPVGLRVVSVPEVRVPHTEELPRVDGFISAEEYERAVALTLGPEPGTATLYLVAGGGKFYAAMDDRAATGGGDYDQFRLYFDRNLDGVWPPQAAEDGEFIGSPDRSYYFPLFNAGQGVTGPDSPEMDPTGFLAAFGFTDHRMFEMSVDLTASHLDVGPEGRFGAYIQSRGRTSDGTRVTSRWPQDVPSLDDQRFFGVLDLAIEGAEIRVTPEPLLFSCVHTRDVPAPQDIRVTEKDDLPLAITASSSASWLSVEPAGGETPLALRVRVDPTGLVPRTYQAVVSIAADGAWNSPHRVRVELEVQPLPARVKVEPDRFSLTVAQDTPDPLLPVTISNLGGRALSYTSSGDAFLSLEPPSGLVGPGGALEVRLRVKVASLAMGSQTGAIVITDPQAEGEPGRIEVEALLEPARPVPPATDLRIQPGDGSLALSWSMPDDPLASGVRIQRALDVAPTGAATGDTVFQGKAIAYLDRGLQNGQRYCYSVFSYDAGGRYGAPAKGCAVAGENHAPPGPELVSPADGAELDNAPFLVCRTVADPDGDPLEYVFRLTGPDGQELESGLGEVWEGQVSFRPTVPLARNVNYTWQVQARDPKGLMGLSEQRTFWLRAQPDGGVPDGGTDPGDGGGCGCGGAPTPAGGVGLLGLLLALTRHLTRARLPL
ncbi:MAG: hypothetical protein GYA21_15105 [Myxococcales bacterium]|nr:hypothetical protein [Myxococcales bacterium]